MITDADLTLLTLYAEDMYRLPGDLAPPYDARAAKQWDVRGYVTGTDSITLAGTNLTLANYQAFYGFLAENRTQAGTFALVLRGTDGAAEWALDAEFLQRDHPTEPGRVEDGFWGVYGSLQWQSLATPRPPAAPLLSALVASVGRGRCLVVGHSLGGALATYLAVDLAPLLLAGRTALRAIASPHPGDSAFAAAAGRRVPDHKVYAYEKDVVPFVPGGLGYAALPNRTVLAASNAIQSGLLCNHHAVTYASLIQDPAWVRGQVGDVNVDTTYLKCLT